MSKRRVSSSTGPPHRGRTRNRSSKLNLQRFLGVSLLGGKNDRTSLTVLEYYPEHQKLFLNHVFEKIKSENEISSDQLLIEKISSFLPDVESLALDVPLQLPKCMRCKLMCPGFEKCKESEIQWMWRVHRQKKENAKNLRLFTPYTQRCVEMHLATELEEPFHLQEAMGANMAPLTARSFYLRRRLSIPVLEVFPQLTLWRLGRSLGLPKKTSSPPGPLLHARRNPPSLS